MKAALNFSDYAARRRDILGSGRSHLMAPEEIVIGRHFDSDFGALELIETRTEAVVNGGPRRPLVFKQWTGKQPEFVGLLTISSREDTPIVADEGPAPLRSFISNI